ncbi:MAG TPA: hypothetical protein VH561_22235 [Micromonosporaceae bacterium]
MSGFFEALSAIATIVGAAATLPGLTRRAWLRRRLARTLQLADSMGEPRLAAARDLLLRSAQRTAHRLRPIETAMLEHPVQTRMGLAMMTAAPVVLVAVTTTLAVSSRRTGGIVITDGGQLVALLAAFLLPPMLLMATGQILWLRGRKDHLARMRRARRQARAEDPGFARVLRRVDISTSLIAVAVVVGAVNFPVAGHSSVTVMCVAAALLVTAMLPTTYYGLLLRERALRILEREDEPDPEPGISERDQTPTAASRQRMMRRSRERYRLLEVERARPTSTRHGFASNQKTE